MNNLRLYIPKLEDYWYQEKIQGDPKTMYYNAGYDVNYDGYHFDTGCIDFPKEKWKKVFENRLKENKFLAYIIETTNNEFVGYVNYQYNSSDKRYDCGILIEDKYRNRGYAKQSLELLLDVAKKNGVKEVYDSFEISRKSSLKLFLDIGFEIVDRFKIKKNSLEEECVLIKKAL